MRSPPRRCSVACRSVSSFSHAARAMTNTFGASARNTLGGSAISLARARRRPRGVLGVARCRWTVNGGRRAAITLSLCHLSPRLTRAPFCVGIMRVQEAPFADVSTLLRASFGIIRVVSFFSNVSSLYLRRSTLLRGLSSLYMLRSTVGSGVHTYNVDRSTSALWFKRHVYALFLFL